VRIENGEKKRKSHKKGRVRALPDEGRTYWKGGPGRGGGKKAVGKGEVFFVRVDGPVQEEEKEKYRGKRKNEP